MIKGTQKSSETQLLFQMRAGNESAFTCLYNLHAAPLFSICLKYTSNKHEAEELVQEVFTRVWVNRQRIIPEMPFLPYLIKIARNLLVDKTRKKLFETAYLRYRQIVQHHYTYSTENQIFLNELKNLLEKQVAEMPEKRKTIFRLSREAGLTNKEIAKKLGVSVSTVENHINTALKQLKKQLGHGGALAMLLILLMG